MSPASADALTILEGVLEPIAAQAGFELLRVEWSGSGRHRVLRCFIDHTDTATQAADVPSAVTLDDCTLISRLLGAALDASEASGEQPLITALLSAPYSLEVSSPGLDRPLARLRHFTRFVGRRAQVKTHGEVVTGSAQRTFHLRICGTQTDPQAPDDDRRGTVLFEEIDTGTPLRLTLNDIRRANLVYEG